MKKKKHKEVTEAAEEAKQDIIDNEAAEELTEEAAEKELTPEDKIEDLTAELTEENFEKMTQMHELKEAIKKSLDKEQNIELRDKLKKMTWDKVAKQIKKVYESVITDKTKRPDSGRGLTPSTKDKKKS